MEDSGIIIAQRESGAAGLVTVKPSGTPRQSNFWCSVEAVWDGPRSVQLKSVVLVHDDVDLRRLERNGSFLNCLLLHVYSQCCVCAFFLYWLLYSDALKRVARVTMETL